MHYPCGWDLNEQILSILITYFLKTKGGDSYIVVLYKEISAVTIYWVFQIIRL